MSLCGGLFLGDLLRMFFRLRLRLRYAIPCIPAYRSPCIDWEAGEVGRGSGGRKPHIMKGGGRGEWGDGHGIPPQGSGWEHKNTILQYLISIPLVVVIPPLL